VKYRYRGIAVFIIVRNILMHRLSAAGGRSLEMKRNLGQPQQQQQHLMMMMMMMM